jgi:type II secretion system protein N
MKKILFSGILAVLIFFGLWFIGISEGLLIELIKNSLKDTPLSVEITDLRKGLFYNFKSQGVMLKRSDKTLLSIENVAGRIHPLSLFLMRITLSFKGDMGGGRIHGRFDLLKGGRQANVHIDNANIEGIPLFATIGLRERGLLSGELKLKDDIGDLRFSIKEARFERGLFSGVMVPLDLFYTARGAMAIKGETIRVVSFSMEGKGVYARIKGNITGNMLDLTIEIMRDSSFEGSSLFSTIESYKVSPGYYVIPIKSSLSF